MCNTNYYKINVRWKLVISTTESTLLWRDVESANKVPVLQLHLSQVQMMIVVLAVTVELHLGPGSLIFKNGMLS